MATTVRADETDLPHLLARARAGEEIIIAEGETAVARLVPIASEPTPKRKDLFGVYAGVASVGPEFFAPLSEEELRAWEGGDAGAGGPAPRQ